MSLTSFLKAKDSFPRKFIDAKFPHLKELSTQINKSLHQFKSLEYVKYSDLYTYSLVGTAMDYRIRSFYSDAPYKSPLIQSGLRRLSFIHSFASEEAEMKYIENQFHSKPNSAIKEFNDFSKSYFNKLNPARRRLGLQQEKSLCRYCVLLARIDHFGRASTSPAYFYDAMASGKFDIRVFMSDTDQSWVEDITALSASFYQANEESLRDFSEVSHGRVLAGSKDIPGGADLDLVVDGCLIEIKTTVKPRITTEHLRQVLGYWLLDYYDALKIRTAAFYLVRQGYKQNLDLKNDLLRTSHSIKELRAMFRDGLRRQFKG